MFASSDQRDAQHFAIIWPHLRHCLSRCTPRHVFARSSSRNRCLGDSRISHPHPLYWVLSRTGRSRSSCAPLHSRRLCHAFCACVPMCAHVPVCPCAHVRSSLARRLRNASVLPLAPGWLCYLAPEIVRLVRPDMFSDDLPFTYYSDVFAFGTLWFELMVGEWPFHCGRESSHPAETLIWLVGNYRKPPLPEVPTPAPTPTPTPQPVPAPTPSTPRLDPLVVRSTHATHTQLTFTLRLLDVSRSPLHLSPPPGALRARREGDPDAMLGPVAGAAALVLWARARARAPAQEAPGALAFAPGLRCRSRLRIAVLSARAGATRSTHSPIVQNSKFYPAAAALVRLLRALRYRLRFSFITIS